MKSNNRDFLVNLVAQMMVFATNLIISFFFTPIVLNKLGNEAYGFVGLVNNFVSYISVITVALNSLAGRFITLSYHRHDEKKVREYFSSVFFADTILGVLVLGAAVILCVRIEYLINIPEYLVSDVRTTVILAFFSSTISLIGVVFGVAAFIKNKLYLNSLNVVNVLGVFHPFAPDAQQAAQNRRLRDGKHIIHLSDFESRTHCSKEIGNYVLHTALLIGLTELRNPDSQHFHAVDFFFVILLRFVLIFNSSQVTRHHTDDRDIELIQHTLRQFTEDLPR